MSENSNGIIKRFRDYINNENKLNNSARSNLKRTYRNFRKISKINEELNIQTLNDLTYMLLENYDSLKNIPEINEILTDIIEDYKYIKQNDESVEQNEKADLIIKNIYTYILGNPGASSKGLDIEFLENIIKEKIKDVEDILVNRDDILNILKEQSIPVYFGNFDRYQKLIEDVIMDSIENNLESITNPKAIDILKDLAISYKNQGNYEKSRKIYEKCLELYKKIEKDSEAIEYEFSNIIGKKKEKDLDLPNDENNIDTNEEESLQKELENITDISKKFNELFKDVKTKEDITRKFLSVQNVNSLEELIKQLNEDIELVDIDNQIVNNDEQDNQKVYEDVFQNGKNYVMPVHEKVEGIQKAIKKLKLEIEKISVFRNVDENKNSEIIRLAQETIKDYSEFVLIKINGLNVSLLECLSTDQRYLQIIPNEKLYEILQFEKVRDQKLNGTINKKHTENTFAYNLTKTLIEVIKCRNEGKPIKEDELGDKIYENEEINVDENRKMVLVNRLNALTKQMENKRIELLEIVKENGDYSHIVAEFEKLKNDKEGIQDELDKLKN